MHKKKNLAGTTFGNLEILEEFNYPYKGKEKNRKTLLKLKCKCKCGFIFYPYKTNVTTGRTTQCSRCLNSKPIQGRKIGKITILRRLFTKKIGCHYECKCDCGNTYIQSAQVLKKIKGLYCQACRPKKRIPLPFPEAIKITNYKKHLLSKQAVVGKVFGYLKVLRFYEWEYRNNRRYAIYECKCKCKNIKHVRIDQLGAIRSCGCLHKEKTPKGEANHKAKLKNAEVYSIKELMRSGIYTQRKIAKMYGVTETVISCIKKGKTYNI